MASDVGLCSGVSEALERGLLQCPDCRVIVRTLNGVCMCGECGSQFPLSLGALDLRPRRARLEGQSPVTATDRSGTMARRFVAMIYARHNDSRKVRSALQRFWNLVPPGALGVNIGSGTSAPRAGTINLDIAAGPNVGLLGDAQRLPFGNASIGWVVTQEVFEHLPDPFAAAREVARVLEKGGVIYLQVPFIIGYHSLPHDYYRFSANGVRELLRQAELEVLEVGASVGAGTSLYRIVVEFVPAILAGLGLSRWYRPVKAVAAVVFAPLRWADLLAPDSDTVNRVQGGFYAIAVRRN